MGYPSAGQGNLINFVPVDLVVGMRGIHETSTTQSHPLGTRCRAHDYGPANLGDAEFIYLQGVAATAPGSVVTYDPTLGLTGLLVDAAAAAVGGETGPLAVAMSANVALSFGWYQIFGQAIVLTADGAIGTPGMVNATAGSLKTAGVSLSDLVGGTVFKSTFGPAATTIAAASNAAALPQASITIAASAGLTAKGLAKVTTSTGVQIVTYTSTDATHLLGATGGTGVMATGGAVESFPGTGFALMQLSYPSYSGGIIPA